ncbi:Phytocyanin domain-containing protein [Balamuthia mandrillaris]
METLLFQEVELQGSNDLPFTPSDGTFDAGSKEKNKAHNEMTERYFFFQRLVVSLQTEQINRRQFYESFKEMVDKFSSAHKFFEPPLQPAVEHHNINRSWHSPTEGDKELVALALHYANYLVPPSFSLVAHASPSADNGFIGDSLLSSCEPFQLPTPLCIFPQTSMGLLEGQGVEPVGGFSQSAHQPQPQPFPSPNDKTTFLDTLLGGPPSDWDSSLSPASPPSPSCSSSSPRSASPSPASSPSPPSSIPFVFAASSAPSLSSSACAYSFSASSSRLHTIIQQQQQDKSGGGTLVIDLSQMDEEDEASPSPRAKASSSAEDRTVGCGSIKPVSTTTPPTPRRMSPPQHKSPTKKMAPGAASAVLPATSTHTSAAVPAAETSTANTGNNSMPTSRVRRVMSMSELEQGHRNVQMRAANEVALMALSHIKLPTKKRSAHAACNRGGRASISTAGHPFTTNAPSMLHSSSASSSSAQTLPSSSTTSCPNSPSHPFPLSPCSIPTSPLSLPTSPGSFDAIGSFHPQRALTEATHRSASAASSQNNTPPQRPRLHQHQCHDASPSSSASSSSSSSPSSHSSPYTPTEAGLWKSADEVFTRKPNRKTNSSASTSPPADSAASGCASPYKKKRTDCHKGGALLSSFSTASTQLASKPRSNTFVL